MIDELTDSDGSNRTEYWKQILLKREYIYNKPINVRGSDGSETLRTMKLHTPHQETHCVWCGRVRARARASPPSVPQTPCTRN
tara:strand:- start:301 stop:549 length:249 start_codon:yes stop_codon:yes gene_type:complete